MRLYIWEGNGISSAYHDDGTLVVLAESPEQAREVARAQVAAQKAWDSEPARVKAMVAWYRIGEREWMREHKVEYGQWESDGGKRLQALRKEFDYPEEHLVFDGVDRALDREPDRVVELDAPAVVAFNGGGYD